MDTLSNVFVVVIGAFLLIILCKDEYIRRTKYSPYRDDSKANDCIRKIRKIKREFSTTDWKEGVTRREELEQHLDKLTAFVDPSKLRFNKRYLNSIQRTLHQYSPQSHEIYHLFLTLKDIPNVDQQTMQMVVNRSNYVFSQMIP